MSIRTLFALIGLCVIPLASSAQSFSDVPHNHRYAPAIAALEQQGIIEGYSDGRFGTEEHINRAEMVKILMLADDMPAGGSYCFTDVTIEWYAAYVCGARDHHMVTGYPDGSFHPDYPVTFTEAAALVVRLHAGMLASGNAPWYMPYYEKLAAWDAIPPSIRWLNVPITRGEMAYMLWKADSAVSGTPPSRHSSSSFSSSSSSSRRADPLPADISLHISANTTVAAPTEDIIYTVTIHNDGEQSATVHLTVSYDRMLEIRSVSHDGQAGTTATYWNALSVEGRTTRAVTIVASPRLSAKKGTNILMRASAENSEAYLVLTVGAERYATALGDPILYWNDVLDQALADDYAGTFNAQPAQNGPGPSARVLAIVHGAVYDAVNSIDRTHTPIRTLVPLPSGTRVSVDAAVAQAAHQTLTALFPAQQSSFDAALLRHLSLLPNTPEKTVGLGVGGSAASAMLNDRATDGWNRVVNYVYQTLPGLHRADPTNPNQLIWGPGWGSVRPFVLQNGSQFRSIPPPAITSPQYAAAFQEAKTLGGDGITTPTQRTEEQTRIGIFWAYDGTTRMGTPPRFHNEIAAHIARQQGNTIAENARYFALVHMALADAGIAAWDSKFYYNYWRPIIAIREADEGTGHSGLGDGNPLTIGDATWTPYGAPVSNQSSAAVLNFTPAFPTYPSGHAAFGGALFHSIALFYGTDNIPFTITSHEWDGVTTDEKGIVRPRIPRSFSTLSQAAQENADSRIYLGIHWNFDATAGIDMGNQVAEYVYANALRPIGQ